MNDSVDQEDEIGPGIWKSFFYNMFWITVVLLSIFGLPLVAMIVVTLFGVE